MESNQKRSHLAFTLLEILLAVAIIVILASVMLAANIKSSLEKARDSTRKQDLNKLARIFEDYYNDHSGYPANNQSDGTILSTTWGELFPEYPVTIPRDPRHPNQEYYYESGEQTQNYFAIYAKLENTADPDIEATGCSNGCGPNLAYNYVVHSTNVIMEGGLPQGSYLAQGQGGPTLTPVAPTDTPAPTANLTPPSPIGDACDFNQCCTGWCGAPSEGQGGKSCVYERCYWGIVVEPTVGWRCDYDPSCS